MIGTPSSQIDRRLYSLEKHLKQENPILLRVVQSFRDLDWVAYRMGVLTQSESYATRVPWWPLISILGTFSAGKSTFINSFLGIKLQRTGNQAVDDKFTVLCYSNEEQSHTLPGLALDADPRFPFYQMSEEIDHVVSGEGRRIDAYLQLKTCPTEKLRGKIFIDSPGFDADDQRTATLRITDHIINLSDVVLVFFDARHPEPGAMRDTLEHLVANTIHRHDSNKFLYILNQVDCTAREDNLEDVVAAWQRALSQYGLTAGRFFQIYNEESALPIEDATLRARYQAKREEDLADILDRIQRVEVERAYRIIGVLEHTAHQLQEKLAPRLHEMLRQWRRRVLIADGLLFGAIGIGVLATWVSTHFSWSWPIIQGLGWDEGWQGFLANWSWGHTGSAVLLAAILGGSSYLHYMVRKLVARQGLKQIARESGEREYLEALRKGFTANTSIWRSIFCVRPRGWNARSQRRIAQVLKDIDQYVQTLNDQFTNPSGKAGARTPKVGVETASPAISP